MSDIQAEGGQPEVERPEWLLEKFKSPEDQAQAYAAAEKELGRVRADSERQQQEFAQALQQIEAERERQPAPQQYAPPGQDPLLLAAQRAWDEGDVATFIAINAQVGQAAVAQTLDQRFSQLDEKIGGASAQDKEIALRLAEQQVAPIFGERWAEIVPGVQQALAANPGILPQQASVEGYAKAITGLAQQVDYPRAKQEAEALAADRQAKLQAQTLAGGQARGTYQANPDQETWAGIKAADAGGWGKVVGG